MAVYPITRYPSEIKLRDGTQVAVRPMTPDDCRGLHAFFCGISEDERFFLKEDVGSPTVIQSWADHLDYDCDPVPCPDWRSKMKCAGRRGS